MSSSGTQTLWQPPIPERSTPLLTLTIVDEAEEPIPSLSTLTFTLHKEGTVINGRTRVNVLGSFSAGKLSFRFTTDDTQILDATKQFELHTALIEWSWDGGTKHGKHEVIHTIRNLATVPAA